MFIKLHLYNKNQLPIHSKSSYINMDNIEAINKQDNYTQLVIPNEGYYSVKETPEEIVALIESKELNKLYHLQDSIRQLMDQASINVRVI